VRRNDKSALGRTQQRLPLRVTAIGPLGRHDPADAEVFRQLAVNVELRRIDPQLIARGAGQSLDVERRTRFRVLADAEDMIGAEDEDIAAPRVNEVVAELIDKDLITGIDRPARHDLAAMINVPRIDLEILAQNLRRRVNGETLLAANDVEKVKKKRNFCGRMFCTVFSAPETTSM
jgi:hypothetical protein